MEFTTEITIRFGDIDHAGIVYYPTLVHYTHLAMEDYFNEYLDYPYARLLNEHRLGLPTVHLEMEFERPVKYGDKILCKSMVAHVGTTSVKWRHRFLAAGREGADGLVAEARIVTVCMDVSTLGKVPVPDWLRARFATT